jgi:large subunit ribosomal protein L5
MEATTTDAPPARLKQRYFEEIRPSLIERFEYSSEMQAPRVQKITLNMGVGMAKQDSKVLKAATEQLATIAGQQPSVRRARKSIAAFKLREGMPVGVAVTLRGERAYEFLDRLVSVAIPRIRDFRGLSPRSFDGRGNYSMGVREQIIFPEIDYDAIDQVRGLDITISTSAATDAEAFALLQALGMPFAAQGRPKGFDPAADEAEAEARAAAYAAEQAQAAAPPAAKPAAAKPAAEKPADEAPTADEPSADEPSADQPTADEPTADEPNPDEPTDDASTADEPGGAAADDSVAAHDADADAAAEPQASASGAGEENAEQGADAESAAEDADEAQASGEDPSAGAESGGDTAEKESSD